MAAHKISNKSNVNQTFRKSQKLVKQIDVRNRASYFIRA